MSLVFLLNMKKHSRVSDQSPFFGIQEIVDERRRRLRIPT